jgi:penicillin-binding protein 1A
VLFLLIVIVWAQRTIYSNLPDVSSIKDMVFAQATVITDRNGKELYKVFDQNRQYVPYEQISQTMINAIVAMEDQRYWDHK